MFLKKLEISGFKSFASKTTLDFLIDSEKGENLGITAIVGPNGSGKSNIADALRWAMGEQSMKNLRGKKSQDIIFAGSGKKARLGSAQVMMYLDNSSGKIPLDFQEVAIGRKIFRSGESEYLINGSRVRLQDLVDILAKAGVGKESYAIINQGMADSVLNASPLERRIVIEDAAGVKQYQIKKERAVRKLETTRQNMAQAKSLSEEIKPHLKMLKRQAERASQSQEVAANLEKKQTLLFSFLWTNFQKERETFNEAKEEAGRVMLNLQREIDKLADELAKEAKESREDKKNIELEGQLRTEKEKLNQLEKELVINEGRIEIEKEKQKNLEMIEEIKIQNIPVDLIYVKREVEEIKRNQEKLIERMENVEKLEDLQEIKEFARAIQERLYNLKSEIEQGKKEEKPVPISSKKEISQGAAIIVESIVKLNERNIILRKEIEKCQEEIVKLEELIRKEAEVEREKRKKFFELEMEMRKKQEELSKLKDNFNESKIALAKVDVREEDLKGQIKNELKKEPEELPEASENVDRMALEEEIRKLKIKMEQIGGIDPMVVDEYQETSKRYEFLTRESEDLEKAISTLKEVVKEMDQKIEKEFEKTYEEINKEFTKYFRIIFGGGNAHLNKLKIQSSKRKGKDLEEEINKEEDTENEENEELSGEAKEDEQTGIEIFACPPGKRISHLSMLSGGERSLTSLALLFAIISHNPPPFAILDEVEAALDEANSRRFGRIITELSRSTQFVIITHNRETMRQASLLYGVTMGDDGISKLLSVRLDQVGAGGKITK